MQITDHIHSLRLDFRMEIRPGVAIERFVNVYLVFGTDGVCVVDTGVAGSEAAILDYVRQCGRRAEDVRMILLTHAHPDHIGAAKALQEATGCLVVAHELERPWIENVDRQARERPVPGFASLVGGPVNVALVLRDGDMVDLVGWPAEVIHTPGHSKGSMSVWMPDEGALLCGDAVPAAGGTPIYDDVLATVKSLRRMKNIPGIRLLLTAWDEPRRDEEAYRVLEEGLQYVLKIHDTVLRASSEKPPPSLVELYRRVLGQTGIQQIQSTPMITRTLAAHLAVKDRAEL